MRSQGWGGEWDRATISSSKDPEGTWCSSMLLCAFLQLGGIGAHANQSCVWDRGGCGLPALLPFSRGPVPPWQCIFCLTSSSLHSSSTELCSQLLLGNQGVHGQYRALGGGESQQGREPTSIPTPLSSALAMMLGEGGKVDSMLFQFKKVVILFIIPPTPMVDHIPWHF